jgi:hypothetical protein
VTQDPDLSTAIRTLIIAGFDVEGARRLPEYIEVNCYRAGVLGLETRALIAITDRPEFSANEIEVLRETAGRQSRSLAMISADGGEAQLTWREFFEELGGQVPSWRALAPFFEEWLISTSHNTLPADNTLPAGAEAEAWSLFEDLVADGLEFVFGRRVMQHGGRKRGQRLSDMIAAMPDQRLLVVDAKATESVDEGGFDAAIHNLRPLGEYVKRQIRRQQDPQQVFGALVVSSNFSQDLDRLREISTEFFSEHGRPVAFMTSDVLATAVNALRERSDIRNAVRWNHVFRGGPVLLAEILSEIDSAATERYSR